MSLRFVRRTLLAPLVAVAALAVAAAAAQAQWAWTNFTGTGTGWTVGTNWDPVGPPTFTTTTALTFGSAPALLPPTYPFQPTGSYTSTATGGTAYDVNQLLFTGTASADTASGGITLTTDTAGGTIRMAGTAPTITQSGTGAVTFANGTATTDLTLLTGVTINGSGTGHVSLNGVVGGTGNITVSHTGTSPLFTGGQVFLGTANTFVGNVVLNSGNLTLGNAAAIGPTATNTLVVNGGTVRTTASTTIANPITLNAQLVQAGTFAATYTGVVSGNGGIRLANSATATTAFQNTVAGTGAINVEGVGFGVPTLALSSLSATVHGTALNAASYTVSFGAITLSNGTANVARLNPAAALTLNNATFSFTGGSTGANTETVGSTAVSGAAQVTLTPTATTSMAFNAGTFTRVGAATLQVTTQGTGLTLGGAPATSGNANLFLGGVTPAANVNGVLPYALASITNAGVAANTLARYDATNGVVPLSLTTDYATTHPLAAVALPAANLLVAGQYTGIAGNRALNSLSLNSPSAAAVGAALTGTGTITLTSGVLSHLITAGATAPTFGAVVRPNLAFPVTGYAHINATTTVVGNLTGANGLVKSGGSLLALYGDNSGLSGGLVVNNGNLTFTRDANLGAPGAGVTVNVGPGGGGFLGFNSFKEFAPVASPTLTIERPLTLGPGGGGLFTAQTNANLVWSGPVGGTGRFGRVGGGVVTLAGTNTFTGDVVTNAGILVANSDAALGTAGNAVVFSNATATAVFQPGPAFASTARNFLFTSTTAAAATIHTDGNDFAIAGQLVGGIVGAAFLKAGAGNLTLTGANTLNGPVQIGDATPTRRASGNFAQPGGTVTLSGPTGALANATAYTLNFATVHLDNSGAINGNRLASAAVTLNGSELKLTGNTGGSVYEHVGVAATNGIQAATLGNTITLTQPAVGGTVSTNLIATSYGEGTAAGLTFFRGTSLGGNAGLFTTVRFVNTTGLLTNNIIRSGLYAGSPTADPQDFATHTVASGVQPFTDYVAFGPSGGTATTTYAAAAAVTQTAAQTINALKVTDASIDLGGNTLSVTGAGALLVTGTGTSAITTASGAPDLAFGTNAARITVNTTLTVGTPALPVRLTGSGGLNKFGPGVLAVSASTVSGPLNVSQGTYRLQAAAAWVSGTTTTISPGATLDVNGFGTPAAPVGTMALSGFGTVAVGAGAIATGSANATFGGGFSGTGTLLNTGSGVQTLNGNSPAFSGGVRVLAGSLTVDANVRPADATNPGPLGTGTTALVLGNTTGTAAATLNFGPNVQEFNRDIVVPAGVANSTALTLQTVNGSIGTISGNVTISRDFRIANTAFSATASGYYTFTGTIADGTAPGRLDFFSGNFNLTGNNTFTGGVFMQAAPTLYLGLGSNTALGTGPIVIANQSFTGGFRADNGARTIANAFDYEAGTTANTVTFTGDNDLTFTAPTVSLLNGATATARTFNAFNTGLVTFTGSLTQTGGGAASLVKAGGGTVALGGANTFTGGVTINGGTVRLVNTAGSGTGTGAVAINSSGRLEGTGISASAISVASGGAIAPGVGTAGTLTIGSTLTFVSGANWAVAVTSAATPGAISTGVSTAGPLPNPTSNTFLDKTAGAAPTTLNLATLLVDLAGTAFAPATDYSYTIARGMGDQSALNVTAANQFLFFNTTGVATAITNPSMTGSAGGLVYLNFSVAPVPEPASVLAVAAAAAVVARRLRRRTAV